MSSRINTYNQILNKRTISYLIYNFIINIGLELFSYLVDYVLIMCLTSHISIIGNYTLFSVGASKLMRPIRFSERITNWIIEPFCFFVKCPLLVCFFFFFSVRCRLAIFVVPSWRWTAPSVALPWRLFPRELSVGQVLSLSLLWRGHGLWFVLPVRRGKGLTFQFQSVSCGYAVCSGLFLAGIPWSVLGAIVSEGCLVEEYSLHIQLKHLSIPMTTFTISKTIWSVCQSLIMCMSWYFMLALVFCLTILQLYLLRFK